MNIRTEYTRITIFILFLIFSHVGWLWEVLLTSSRHGFFINRGFMHGPWLPVYGVGAVLLIVCLKKIQGNVWFMFLASSVLCGTLEYFTALALETLYKRKWWDYNDYYFNIQGRTCLLVVILFGILGTVLVGAAGPVINNWLLRIPEKRRKELFWILLIIFAGDYFYSLFSPNMGVGITGT